MKKILSLTLAVLMLISIIPTAFAAEVGGNWSGGTQVTYTTDGTEYYTLTVPAELVYGGDTGTVTLSGSWASNRVVTVTADNKVTLKNTIKDTDTKDIDVSFGGIEQYGDNKQGINVTETIGVSCEDMSGVLFGTWVGHFNYYVEVDDYYEMVNFTIFDVDYEAPKGMTWGDFIDSEYNTYGFVADENNNIFLNVDDTSMVIYKDEYMEKTLTTNDVITETTYWGA